MVVRGLGMSTDIGGTWPIRFCSSPWMIIMLASYASVLIRERASTVARRSILGKWDGSIFRMVQKFLVQDVGGAFDLV